MGEKGQVITNNLTNCYSAEERTDFNFHQIQVFDEIDKIH